jgi:hypothetical protein
VVADFDAEIADLVSAARTLGDLLRVYGEESWADWVVHDGQRIAEGDRYGIDHLLGAFGGMGSLNDLVIHPMNGHPIAAADVDSVNKQLGGLRTRVYLAANRVRRGLGRPG